ncbi:HD domain-containing protein [Cecembia rubra]|nr:HD domain-containing protein [Cecembia rubra]
MAELEVNLPTHLTYHNYLHTQYVIEKAQLIGEKENLSDKALELLMVAALFHDMGYLFQKKDHENISCKIVEKELPSWGFSQEEIDEICTTIMATKVPQNPKNHLGKILADADLEYLGTDLFQKGSSQLFQELVHDDPALNEEKWLELQIDFLMKHRFHTRFCKLNREPKKQEHLQKLLQKVKSN